MDFNECTSTLSQMTNEIFEALIRTKINKILEHNSIPLNGEVIDDLINNIGPLTAETARKEVSEIFTAALGGKGDMGRLIEIYLELSI